MKNFRNDKGQTLTEFVLVFTVLLLASYGAFVMYKTYWKKKYEKTAYHAGTAAGVAAEISEKRRYVK